MPFWWSRNDDREYDWRVLEHAIADTDIENRFEDGEAMENPTPWKRQAIAVLPAPTNL